MDLSRTVKIFVMVIVICGIINTPIPYTKVLGFVACSVTSKVLGMGYAECSWDDVKTIKSGNRSALGSDISEKQSIVYSSACIE